MNTMKKIIAFAMIATMVLGCFVFSTSAAEQAEYVQDGLIAWYDASNNSNGSQDPMADYWKDLTGNLNHIDLRTAVSNNQITWTDNALMINGDTGCYLALPDGVKNALQGDAYTIEIVTGELNYTATEYITLLSSSNDELSVFIRCSGEYAEGQPNQFKLEYKNQDANGDSNRPYMYDAWNQFNGKTLAVTADLGAFDGTRDMEANPAQDGNVLMFSDGTQIAKGESEHNMTLDYVYLGHTNSVRRWGGEIYALRIYDRALTEEEIQDNAAADQVNYRQGNKFEPVERYDPAKDAEFGGGADLSIYDNKILVFNADTDLIPLIGFYGSQNLLDYLYPYESDEEQWVGARLMKTEEPDTDFDGNEFTSTSFDILYQSFCSRAGLQTLTGKDVQYIVIELIVNGEFEDFNMNTICYDVDVNDDVEFSTGSIYGGIDFDKEGQVQYLIFDVEGIFDDCEQLMKMSFDISGMDDETEIFLQRIGFFASEKEAYEFAGEEWVEPETDPETEAKETEAKETEAKETEAKETEAKGNETEAKGNETEAPDEGGCASVVGFGAAAILVAAAAAVVLKKKD